MDIETLENVFGLERVEGQTFENVELPLTGMHYYKCHFKNVTFLVSGGVYVLYDGSLLKNGYQFKPIGAMAKALGNPVTQRDMELVKEWDVLLESFEVESPGNYVNA